MERAVTRRAGKSTLSAKQENELCLSTMVIPKLRFCNGYDETL